MKLFFDLDFDGNSWPGPLGEKKAVIGEAWVGPIKLLGILETAFGLGGRYESDAGRAAALVPAVRNTKGFWSKSAEVDPLGVARTLLRWRDELWMEGWKGEGVATRLEQLSQVTRELDPGLPDRARAVIAAISRWGSAWAVEEIVLLEPPEVYPFFLLRQLLSGLKGGGTKVTIKPLEQVRSQGDLQSSREGNFTPKRDGSLQLLRAPGILAAAEETAAWASTLDKAENIVIIAPDPILDRALRSFGMPTTGAVSPGDNVLLQIVPLVLALAWSPPDPRHALELLTLPVSPVPYPIRGYLVEALHTWPAVDSDKWREAIQKGIEKIETESDRKKLAERLSLIFSSPVKRGGPYPVSEIERRVSAIEKWVRGRVVSEVEAVPWHAALEQCGELKQLVQLSGLKELAEPQLKWFVEEATKSVTSMSLYPAQSGLSPVTSPGSLVGPARNIIWWNFYGESAPKVSRLPLSREELKALSVAGVNLEDPGQVAIANAKRWRRPLMQAAETLLLVCQKRDSEGEELFPHPLWDEITSRVQGEREKTVLVVQRPQFDRNPARNIRQPLAIMGPRAEWKLPEGLVISRAQESPTSLESLIGCPLKYIAEYLGNIKGGETATLSEGEQLWGRLVHEILERLLKNPKLTPAGVENKARELFDNEGPRLAASLFLPGAEDMKATVRHVTVQAARALFKIMKDLGLQPMAIEEQFERNAFGVKLLGRPDLIFVASDKVEGAGESDRRVVDLKWRGEGYRIESLEAGTAFQLAVYSYLVSKGAIPKVPGAYFILRSQRFLTDDEGAFPTAEPFEGPGLRKIWNGLDLAYKETIEKLRMGVVRAPVDVEDDKRKKKEANTLDEETGMLRLGPPCKFCNLALICGRLGK